MTEQLKAAAQQALDALCMPCKRWNATQHMLVSAAIDALRAALAAPAVPTELTSNGARCVIIPGCDKCAHAHYYSAGRYECLKIGRQLEGEGRPATPPAWCPLPMCPVAAAPQPAAEPAVPTEPRPTRKDLIAGLKFYAGKDHFMLADESAWDTVSGEPPNYWCDEAGTATVEDGTVARMVLDGKCGADHLNDPDAAAPQPASR